MNRRICSVRCPSCASMSGTESGIGSGIRPGSTPVDDGPADAGADAAAEAAGGVGCAVEEAGCSALAGADPVLLLVVLGATGSFEYSANVKSKRCSGAAG